MKWPPYEDTRQIWKVVINRDSPQDNWLMYSYEKMLFRTGKQPSKHNVTGMLPCVFWEQCYMLIEVNT